MSAKFYTAFGQLTAVFAHMEGDLRCMIAGIAFPGDTVAAAAFLDSSQLAANLETLRKLSRKFWNHHERLKALTASIDRLRPRRNLFIHGLWHPGDFDTPGGKARVTDLKTTYEAKTHSRSWTHGQTQSFSLADFQSMHGDVIAVINEIAAITVELEETEELEFPSPGGGGIVMCRPTTFEVDDLLSLGRKISTTKVSQEGNK